MKAALDRARTLLDTPPPAPVPGQLAAPAPGLRIGSVCSGYRGLDMAVEEVFGGTTAWVSDIDPGANQILAHHWPDTPNHGDLKTTDWAAVEPVDIYCGGYPCQPFSNAGQRKGTDDERHIWPWIADSLRVLRPRIAVFENVAGHLRLGFDTVLADLARLGFDAEWCLVRASEVGAAHQRNRLFLLAWPADAQGQGQGREGQGVSGRPADGRRPAPHPNGVGSYGDRARGGRRDEPAPRRVATADTHRNALREQPVGQPRRSGTAIPELSCSDAPADAGRRGRTGHGELPAGRNAIQRGLRADTPRCDTTPTPHTASHGHGNPWAPGIRGIPAAALAGRPPAVPDPDADWGRFTPAIARWSHATGRRAPWATDDRNRLNPAFVEWLMGLPAGHVTAAPGLTRNQMLHALGNGVVPQQAAAALRLLAARAGLPTTT